MGVSKNEQDREKDQDIIERSLFRTFINLIKIKEFDAVRVVEEGSALEYGKLKNLPWRKKNCAKNHNAGEQREVRLKRFLIGQTN